MAKLIEPSGSSASRRSNGFFMVGVVLLLLPVIFVASTTASAPEHGVKSGGTGVDERDGRGNSESGISREDNVKGQGNNTGHGGGHGDNTGFRYHVAKFDFSYVKIHFIVGIWILYAGAAKIFFHQMKWLSFFPESCMLIIIGVLLGLALYFDHNSYYELNTTTFFLVLLPPIILDAGYFMPARPFFDQLGTILLHAVMGTLLNTLWLGFSLWGVYEGGGFSKLESPLLMLHALVFASLLAAVDPVAVIAVFEAIHVNEILYIVVFGESLLNDGISVVLYHVFEGFSEIGIENIQGIDIFAGFASFFVIVFGATGIGMVMGLFGGFMSRFTHHVPIMEPLIVYVIGYLSFLVAEMFHLSGILSCTFCGITMRKYVDANISRKSKATLKQLMKIAATCCEIIIFMYLGISAVSDTHHWDTGFCLLTLFFCLVFRALGVVVLTYLANLIRVVKLTMIDQFIMAYGGLRGAIAFALVISLHEESFPHRKMFITTTILVIYFTNLVMGTTIKPLVEYLRVKKADKRKPTMTEKMSSRFMDHVMSGIEDIADQQGHHRLREGFAYVNNTYLKPIVVGTKNPQRRGWQILSRFNSLDNKAAQQIIRNANSTTSLSVLFRQAFEADAISRSSSMAQLVASPTTMNYSASGYSDGWQWGVSESSSDIRSPVRFDSIVGLDQQSHDNTHDSRQKDTSKKHSAEKAFQLQPVKDRRGAVKDGEQSSGAGPRLYAPRRQPEYEPRSDVTPVPLSPVNEENPDTPRTTTTQSAETVLSVENLGTPHGITFTTKSYADTKAPAMTVAESNQPWKRDFDPPDSPTMSAGVRPSTSGTSGEEHAAGSDRTSQGVGDASKKSAYPLLELNAVVNVNQGYDIENGSDSENNRRTLSRF